MASERGSWSPPGFLLTFLGFSGREQQKPALAILSNRGV